MQEEKSRKKRSWTNRLNALQIHYSFIKFCIYCFSFRYEFYVHFALRVEKLYQYGLDVGPLEFHFLLPMGCLTNPFSTPSLCFGVISKTPVLIFRNNFVKKIVCIGHRNNVLARCDSILSFAQVSRSVEQNVHTTFSFPNTLSEPEELQSCGCSKILLSFLMRIDGHF